LDESFRSIQDDDEENHSFLNEDEFTKEPNTIVPDVPKKRKDTEIKPLSKDTRINIPSIPQSRSNPDEEFNPRGNS